MPPNALAPIFSVSSTSCVFGPHEDGNIIRLVESLSALFICMISPHYTLYCTSYHAIYTHVNPPILPVGLQMWKPISSTHSLFNLYIHSPCLHSVSFLAHAIRASYHWYSVHFYPLFHQLFAAGVVYLN